MKGTRPLDNNEIHRVSRCFTGTFATRNRGLFMLGVSTGGRISELLSLTIGDVFQNGKAVTDLLYNKRIVKGGEVSRAVPVNIDGRAAIEALINWHREKYGTIAPSRPLFPSRNKKGSVAMNRQTAHDMLKEAFMSAGLNGKLATHSLRKSFAQRVYEQSGDIYLVQELLGHANVSTTQKYIGVNYATARETVEGMALGAESYRTTGFVQSNLFVESQPTTKTRNKSSMVICFIRSVSFQGFPGSIAKYNDFHNIPTLLEKSLPECPQNAPQEHTPVVIPTSI